MCKSLAWKSSHLRMDALWRISKVVKEERLEMILPWDFSLHDPYRVIYERKFIMGIGLHNYGG